MIGKCFGTFSQGQIIQEVLIKIQDFVLKPKKYTISKAKIEDFVLKTEANIQAHII